MGGTIGRVASTIENGKFKLINEQGLQDVQLSKNENGHHSNGGFYPLQRVFIFSFLFYYNLILIFL